LEKIAITIAGANEDRLRAITSLLARQDDFLITGTVEDAFGLVNATIRRRPDVVVMDFGLDGSDTLNLVSIVRRNSPATAIVVLCPPGESVAVELALRAGISGCLQKGQEEAGLALAVRCVFGGGLYFGEEARREVFGRFAVRGIASLGRVELPVDIHRVFTHTELQVFLGVIRGHSDSRIAEELNISEGTVRNCICRAKKKVGLQNRTQMGIYVLAVGLVDWENDFLSAPKP